MWPVSGVSIADFTISDGTLNAMEQADQHGGIPAFEVNFSRAGLELTDEIDAAVLGRAIEKLYEQNPPVELDHERLYEEIRLLNGVLGRANEKPHGQNLPAELDSFPDWLTMFRWLGGTPVFVTITSPEPEPKAIPLAEEALRALGAVGYQPSAGPSPLSGSFLDTDLEAFDFHFWWCGNDECERCFAPEGGLCPSWCLKRSSDRGPPQPAPSLHRGHHMPRRSEAKPR